MMVLYKDFNDGQAKLYQLMSDISEDCWFAGWMMGNEYAIWECMHSGDLRYGFTEMDDALLNQVRELGKQLQGWIVWDDASGDVAFVNVTEWMGRLQKLKDLETRHNARQDQQLNYK
jgi:hypothetical protein